MRKYQFYSSGDDGNRDVYGANWRGQTFTPEITHIVSKVKLKLFRVGTPGLITVVIKATSYEKPTGGDLCKGTLSGDDITDDTGGEWLEISLGDGQQLVKGTQYAIIIKALNGDAGNYVSIRADVAESTYAGGTDCGTTDSGADWDTYSATDLMFEEWGVGPPSPTTVCWQNLAKSQISAEIIEEAIIRLIQGHEDDPDAHLETGESLQSHKASEIIDHLAESIITDKIEDGSIIIQKMEDFRRTRVSLGLESLTGWDISSSVDLDFAQMCFMASGNDTANCFARTRGAFKMKWDKALTCQWAFRTYYAGVKTVHVVTGSVEHNEGEDQNMGFKVETDTLYALHTKSNGITDTEYKTEIEGITVGDNNLYRIEYDPGVSIKFYVNNVLKVTHTANLPDTTRDDTNICNIRIYNNTASFVYLQVRQIYFSQDI